MLITRILCLDEAFAETSDLCLHSGFSLQHQQPTTCSPRYLVADCDKVKHFSRRLQIGRDNYTDIKKRTQKKIIQNPTHLRKLLLATSVTVTTFDLIRKATFVKSSHDNRTLISFPPTMFNSLCVLLCGEKL